MNTAPQPKTRRLVVKYVLALILMGLLISVTHLISKVNVERQFTDAPIINAAGRQRAFSQQIAKETLLLAQSVTPKMREIYRQSLADAAKEWSSAHNGLRDGENSPEIDGLFAEMDPYYKNLQNSLDEITALDPAALARLFPDSPPIEEIVKNAPLFLNLMERIVSRYEKEARVRIERHELFEDYGLFAALTLLVLSGVFVFHPMVRGVRSNYEGLQAANRHLEDKAEERKRTEETLRQQAQVIDQIHDSVISTDLGGLVTGWNKGAEKLFGYSSGEMTGKHISHVYPEGVGREQLINTVVEPLKDKGEHEIEVTMRKKSGEIFHANLSLSMLRDEDGNAVGMIGYIMDITARKRAEKKLIEYKDSLEKRVAERTVELTEANSALRESEENFRGLFENAAIGMTRTGLDGRFLQANRALCNMLGYSEKELLGIHFKNITHPDDRETDLKALPKMLSGQFKVYRREKRYLHKQGHTVWVWLNSVLVRGEDGEPVCFTVQMQDITERKLAEEALKLSEEKYRTLVDKMQDGIILVQDEKFRFVNEASAKMIGYTIDELVGMKFHQVVAPEDLEMVSDRYYKRQAGEDVTAQYELRLLHKDGKTRVVAFMAPGIITYQGRVATLATVKDITERKRAEDAIRKSEEQLRIITDNLPAFIAYVDSDRRFRFANILYEKYFGIPHGEIPGRHVSDVLGGQIYEKARKNYDRALSGETVTWEGEFTFDDAKTRFLNITYIPHFGDGGKVKGFFALSFDVTEKRKMEQELLKAQKLESIGVLAGGIAHDFNNLLHLILGNVSIAKISAKPGSKIFNRLVETERATLRAEELARQLLTFSVGGAPVKKTVDIKKLLMETVKFNLSGTNVKCDFTITDDLSHVEIDDGQVNQVLNNIIINAKQAMPDGGVIEVRAENMEVDEKDGLPLNSGRYVKISIQDGGPGIAKEDQHKVFDPFFTSKAEGSGLGLAISYSIVKNHGGLLGVESETGKGAAFYIYLQASDKTARTRGQKKKLIRGKGRILIMDDDHAIRDVAVSMLDTLGYETEVAINGEEAVEKFKAAQRWTKPYDLVVLDLTVRGGMGGLEAVKKLKRLNPDVKVLVSSGYSTDTVLSDFYKHGFCGSVSKPYEVETFSHEVSKALGLA